MKSIHITPVIISLLVSSSYMLLASSSYAEVTKEGDSFLYIVPRNNTSYGTQGIKVLGNLSSAEHAVFQVSEDLPLVTMQKSLSFEDDNHEYALFEVDGYGDTLNIMAIKGSNEMSRFVGYVIT